MPVVRMKDHISGGRWDGRAWPPANGEIEVPEWEATDLIRGQLAVLAGGGAGRSAVPAPQPEAPAQNEPGAGASTPLPGRPPEPAPVAPPEVSAVAEVYPAAEVAQLPDAQPPDAEDPPAPGDIKQKWIDYAITQGEDPATAAAMTKADLMSKHGGRL